MQTSSRPDPGYRQHQAAHEERALNTKKEKCEMLSYVTGGKSHEDDGVKLVDRPVVLETNI